MGPEREGEVHEELKRVLAECYSIGYTAGYFRNDLANSNPAKARTRLAELGFDVVKQSA
jgi:hypothetical protein